MNTGASHGSALGADEIAATKTILGFDPEKSFEVSDEVIGHTRGLLARGSAARPNGPPVSTRGPRPTPRPSRCSTVWRPALPDGWTDALLLGARRQGRRHPFGVREGALGSRSGAAGTVGRLGRPRRLQQHHHRRCQVVRPGVDLDVHVDRRPVRPHLHFGIREHAMGSILSGIVLHGPTRAYGGTFLQFADYMRPAVRLAALMEIAPIYVWTHDSIGLGEDGPTHQPVEHLAALRAIPHLDVVRPADANETAYAWAHILTRHNNPAGLALTRQNVPSSKARPPRCGRGRLRPERIRR